MLKKKNEKCIETLKNFDFTLSKIFFRRKKVVPLYSTYAQTFIKIFGLDKFSVNFFIHAYYDTYVYLIFIN